MTHNTFQELLLAPFNVHEILGFEILSSEKHFCNWEITEILLRVRGLVRPVPSSSFDRSAKNRGHASKIRSHVDPRGNQELCLTTLECPGFRHHPHERSEFLSPLLLLFLWFIDFSAAPKHCRNASTGFTGMRPGRGAGLSTRLCLVHALIIDWARRLLLMQCPEFSTDCVIAFAQHGLPEQRGQTSQWWAAAKGLLA